MAEGCLFCRIVAGEIPCTRVYEDDHVLAFRDINPQAPTHVLVIPKTHVGNVASMPPGEVLGQVLAAAAKVARQEGIEEGGYRLVFNIGVNAGESVPHLHLHVLGGRDLTWPPG
jgi:histidine triad (HIT) family protein